MALYKRKGLWWVDITHNGGRIRKSTGTAIKLDAQRYHDKLKAELWHQRHNPSDLPNKYWLDAACRWLNECSHKRSLEMDKMHLRWIDPYLRGKSLLGINSEVIEAIAVAKEKTGVKPASVNRMLEIIRAILRKAKNEWNWLESVPNVRMRKVENRRIRWLTSEEVNQLLKELPQHLKDMAIFTLLTGLRESNVTGLKWEDVDLERGHAHVHPDKSKTKKAIPVPLNAEAIKLLESQLGKHPLYVFTYKGKPVSRCNNHAWRKALIRAGISNFRWHDLRHTWASWHTQNGTSLQTLQMLGGWSNFEMVLRYAHLSSEHLRKATENIHVTKMTQSIW